MNWEVAGSVAEVVGAIAVVVSIIYLARQVTHANRTAEAATTLEVSRLLAEWHGRLNQTPELAYIFIHGTSDSSDFSEVEKARFLATVAELFIVLEGLYRQHLLGYVSDTTWKPLELFLARIASSPNVRPWWDSKISMNGEDFRDYVDEICKKHSDTDYARRLNEQI